LEDLYERSLVFFRSSRRYRDTSVPKQIRMYTFIQNNSIFNKSQGGSPDLSPKFLTLYNLAVRNSVLDRYRVAEAYVPGKLLPKDQPDDQRSENWLDIQETKRKKLIFNDPTNFWLMKAIPDDSIDSKHVNHLIPSISLIGS